MSRGVPGKCVCAAFKSGCCAVSIQCKLCMWNILTKKIQNGSNVNYFYENVLTGKKTACALFA